MLETEELLLGGNVATVHRVGETVRRKPGPCTVQVNELLAYVRSKGVAFVPQPLGFDELGRQVLSFISGEVPHDLPPWLWAESVLDDAARTLRRWHDATVDYVPSTSVWGLPPRIPAEVICHNDFAPYNCVFRDHELVGVIDFDACSPGPRAWDIAYALYRFVPLTPPVTDAIVGETSPFPWDEMLHRTRRFLDAYAASDSALLFSTTACFRLTVERLQALATWTERHSIEAADPSLLEHARMYRTHASWLEDRVGG